MKKIFLPVAFLALAGFASCNKNAEKSDDAAINSADGKAAMHTADSTAADTGATAPVETVDTAAMYAQRITKGTISIYPYTASPKFPDAKLTASQPDGDSKVPGGAVKFEYALQNYELTKQTPGMAHEQCANSKEGQHIHNIVDNEPYTAHYTTSFTKDIKDGHHVVLSFLSRSYHESLKHREAYDLRQFSVGNVKTAKPVDLGAPHLFYSRPKGEYVGKDTKKVLLDFYLVNTTLAKDGNQVRATINGNAFMIPAWEAYIIEGLPMGESTIKLELLDKAGKLIPGPFNSVERKITLKEA